MDFKEDIRSKKKLLTQAQKDNYYTQYQEY